MSHTVLPEKNLNFLDSIGQTLSINPTHSAEAKWNTLREAMYNTALTTYGKKERKITDWHEANITVMEPVTEAKRYALINFKSDLSKKNLNALRAARNKAQQTARRCATGYNSARASNCLRHLEHQVHV